jgi:ABC-type multidrug transport system fused ATPase/permease subunit
MLLVFKAGRIVESGSYDELVRHGGGVFTALVRASCLVNPADDTNV